MQTLLWMQTPVPQIQTPFPWMQPPTPWMQTPSWMHTLVPLHADPVLPRWRPMQNPLPWSCDLWYTLGSQYSPPPRTEWQTCVKTLRCPKLRLREVKIATKSSLCELFLGGTHLLFSPISHCITEIVRHHSWIWRKVVDKSYRTKNSCTSSPFYICD